MCGRLSIISATLNKQVSHFIQNDFNAINNTNLTPKKSVSILANIHGHIRQVNTKWGIQPDWSKKLIINAQSETASVKQTFRVAFRTRRCVVPCSGWFEWSNLDGKKKKYLFNAENNQPLYMAGLCFDYLHKMPELVTLTTKPTELCAQYHNKMPLLLSAEDISSWIMLPPARVSQFLTGADTKLKISLAT